MRKRNIDPSVRQSTLVTLSLALLMLIPVGFDLEASELPDSTILNASESAPDANLYKLYFVWPGQNQTSGMDGLISTEPPEADQDQEVASALDDDVQFMSISLMSSMEFFGRKFHADNSYYIPVELFLKSEGSQNSNVDWTVSVMTSERTVGSTIYSGSVCSSSFGSSCDFDHEIIDVGIGNSESFQVGKNERLIIKVRASMSGCDDSDNPFGGSCTAEVAFNNIDNEPNKFSKMEANGNALMNSIIVVQREGANIAEGSVVDWYPNDI
ncbi:MAG: hypothetical protein ABGX21_04365, partial [Candidatus Poseidoniia archaeon]